MQFDDDDNDDDDNDHLSRISPTGGSLIFIYLLRNRTQSIHTQKTHKIEKNPNIS